MPEKYIDLEQILHGCRHGNRNSQRMLYEHFYGYAMNICLRYTRHREEAIEMLNDGFFKVLNSIDKFDGDCPFRPWLRRIFIHTAIDYYRKNHTLPVHLELTAARETAIAEMPMPQISGDEDLLPILRELSPAYRVVFNLYVIEEYSHREIADLLGIDIRTSRSNLLRAKENIRALLLDKTLIRSN